MPKRRSKIVRRRKRTSADWVYRPTVQGDDNNAETFGGWTSLDTTTTLTVGQSVFFVLYDSTAFLAHTTGVSALYQSLIPGTSAYSTMLPGPARAESRGQLPVAVAMDGTIHIAPSTWTLGSHYLLGARLGWFEQDSILGQILVEPQYSIFTDVSFGWEVGAFANNPQENIKTWNFSNVNAIVDNSGYREQKKMFWLGRRRAPSPNHALALFVENASGDTIWSNISVRLGRQIRALISDRGGGA